MTPPDRNIGRHTTPLAAQGAGSSQLEYAVGDPRPGEDRRPSAGSNVAAWLSWHAARRPDAPALVVARRRRAPIVYETTSFARAEELARELAAGLRGLGIGAGERIVVMLPPGRAFFALAFAAFRIGAVLVAVDPGMGIARVRGALREAEPSVFAGTTTAQIARCLLGWSGPRLASWIAVAPRAARPALHALSWLAPRGRERPRGIDLAGLAALGRAVASRTGVSAETPAPVEPDTVAAILFTSGSTGPPKGAVYTHGMFHAQLEALRRAYRIEPGERELATFPLFALFAPALGMTAVVPRIDFMRPGRADGAHLARVVADHAATSMFGSPALLRRLLAAATPSLATLRRVVSAGAPVPAATLEALARRLDPEAEIHTPYGATEALPVATIGSREILGVTRRATDSGAGVCVGRAVPGVEIAIIVIADEPLPELAPALRRPPGVVGEIAVSGPMVTREYFRRPIDTEAAKMRDGRGRTWHRMGDLGYLDEHGRLWFCGRKGERVSLEGCDLYTARCEGIFDRFAPVYRSALVAAHLAGRLVPVICLELEPGQRAEAGLLRALAAAASANPDTRSIRHFLVHPGFPVDPRHNSKIDRAALGGWASRRIGSR